MRKGGTHSTRRAPRQIAAIAYSRPSRRSAVLEGLCECREARLSFRIVHGQRHEHPDAPYALGLLRAR